MSSVRHSIKYLTSDDMSLLERVHSRICDQRYLSKESLTSIRIAVGLIKHFQMGETDPEMLYAMFQREITLPSSKENYAHPE